MPPPDERHPDRPEEVTTWLVIPYFDDDIGRPGVERPIPPNQAVPWLCTSIIVNGVPGGTAFRRGVPIHIAVEVANWGAGALPAIALVRLWWSDPTLSFASATLFGQTSVPVPPTGQPQRVGDFTLTIPEGASPHVCLLAQVSAPLDGASGVPDPHGDRHWAQLNLLEVTAATGESVFPVPFLLANPFPHEARSRVAVEEMPHAAVRLLSEQLGIEIRPGEGAEIEIRGERLLNLPPQSSQWVEAWLRVPGPPGPGERQGYVLTQLLWRDGDPEERVLTGSLGVLLEGR